MRNKERLERLEQIITAVKALPIEKVLGEELELFRRGRNYLALCPFHPDNHIGSFVIAPDRGIYHCFACGHGGNVITFYMDYYEIPFLEAVFKLAVDFNVISIAEYQQLSKKKFDMSEIKHVEIEATKTEKPQMPVADADVLHNVYKAMPEVCALSEQHKTHLLKERMLREEDLKDYFTFPTRHINLPVKVFKQVEENVRATVQDEEKVKRAMSKVKSQLKIVPGFYLNLDKTCLDFVSYKGIGFLVKDDLGHVKGIQIRRDVVKPGESRYIWFSSAFASSSSGCEGGGASGAPSGVVFSKTGPAKELCITEGRFKAEALASRGNDAVYVSGVNTWRNAMPIVERLAEKNGKKRLFMFFDADMLGNVAVHEQLKEFATALGKKGLTPYVVIWAKGRGKGFDDLLNNLGDKYTKALKSLVFSEFEKLYQEKLKAVLKEFKVEKPQALQKDSIDRFVTVLQKIMEGSFELC